MPPLEAGAEAVGRDPDEIRRIRQKSVAWADDERAAREAAGFWRGSLAVGFDEVEFLSSSPDQRRFVAALGDAVGGTG